MKDPGACLDISKGGEGPGFVLTNYAIRKEFGGRVAWGNLISIADDEMERRGLDIVLENMNGFDARDSSEGFELDGNLSAQSKFESEHEHVSVTLTQDSVLQVCPMHPVRGGGLESRPGEAMQIQLPSTNEDFFRALMEAFSILKK